MCFFDEGAFLADDWLERRAFLDEALDKADGEAADSSMAETAGESGFFAAPGCLDLDCPPLAEPPFAGPLREPVAVVLPSLAVPALAAVPPPLLPLLVSFFPPSDLESLRAQA